MKGYKFAFPRPSRSVHDRLWDKVDGPWVEGVEWDACWTFTGSWRSKYGYGRVRRGRAGQGSTQAHVVAFEQFWGPLDPRHEVRHACGNAICCNPWHLAPGTHIENSRDRYDPEFAWACSPLGKPPAWWPA